jgi:hypothetical protein
MRLLTLRGRENFEQLGFREFENADQEAQDAVHRLV